MKIIACTLILRDDFNNILALKKKAKRGQTGKWSLVTQPLTAKGNCEKSLNKGVNKILKTVLFGLEEFKEYNINSDEAIKVYTGTLKERYVLDKTYDEAKWISKNNLDTFEFEEFDEKILRDYFNR
ncbi:hypothetical protein [Clostridium weizhouense]|uniref:NUDIX hydrolase n=1 Tax=Clostridium weizhouense TaxID=2859781 RepID=A0ABS7APN5_9CLOT|nr:hypothetical protein [Clostridium weizhouense]MBW6410619.1 hypothetical protein [Clostridium weizhouense]